MAQRVLVVDDSPTIRKVVAGVLSRAGYEVGHAGDGAQALTVLKREKFNLALVDFVMPKVNGFELCKKLREDSELRDLPVVLMSAKADKIREHFLRQTGALDAITKPFDPRALLLMIEGALQKVEDGKRRRVESFPPESGGGGPGAENTLTDPFSGPPASLRAAVPEAFLRRIGEAIARSAPLVRGNDARDGVAALRQAIGEDGLAGLYSDLAGATANAVLSGDLGAIPLAEILQLLQLQRQTGILTVFVLRKLS